MNLRGRITVGLESATHDYVVSNYNTYQRRPSPKRKGYGLFVSRDGHSVMLATNETQAGLRNTAAAMGLNEYTISPARVASAWEMT